MPRRRAARRRAAVAEVPPLRHADTLELLDRQSVSCEPWPGVRLDDVVDLFDAAGGFSAGELLAGLGTLFQEVLFPERAAAEHAARSRLHRHLDLTFVIGEIDAGGEEDPRPFRRRIELAKVLLKLLVGLASQRAGEFRLVDIAEAAELASTLEYGVG